MDAELSKRRLMLLVEKLHSILNERFDYTRWVGCDWEGAPDLSCGTTACALGWATAVPELAEAGLCLCGTGLDIYVSLTPEAQSVAQWKQAHRYYSAPFKAASFVFGITEREAEYLFLPTEMPPFYLNNLESSPSGLATAKEVADHIEAFVEARWPGL